MTRPAVLLAALLLALAACTAARADAPAPDTPTLPGRAAQGVDHGLIVEVRLIHEDGYVQIIRAGVGVDTPTPQPTLSATRTPTATSTATISPTNTPGLTSTPDATQEYWPTFPGEPPIPTSQPTATAQASPTPIQPLYVCPTAGYVNVRAGASTSTAILGQLLAGQRASVKTIWHSVWAQVSYKGQTGYVHLDFATYCTSGALQ